MTQSERIIGPLLSVFGNMSLVAYGCLVYLDE